MINKNTINNAVKKNNKHKRIRSWLRNNRHIFLIILFWYVYLVILAIDKINNYRNNHFVENVTKTTKYFDKAFTKLVVNECEDTNAILVALNYSDSDCDADFSVSSFMFSWCLSKKYKKYFHHIGKERLIQILKDYVIDGYEKVYIDNWTVWRKLEQQFDWWQNIHSDWQQAILFYIPNKE